MNSKLDADISRRRFLVSTSMATTVALLAPRHMFAQDEGLVQTARFAACLGCTKILSLRFGLSLRTLRNQEANFSLSSYVPSLGQTIHPIVNSASVIATRDSEFGGVFWYDHRYSVNP